MDIKKKYKLNQNLQNQTFLITHSIIADFTNLFFKDLSRLKLDWMDFSQFSDELKDITYCVNVSSKPVVGSSIRKSSVYFNEEKIIVFNVKELSGDLGTALVIIHEILGSLGYPDENYQITSYLYSYFHKETFSENTVNFIEKALRKFLETNPRRMENLTFDGSALQDGGVSGVGGGGDRNIVALKAFALNMALINKEYFIDRVLGKGKTYLDFLTFLLNLRIESLESGVKPKKIIPFGNDTGVFIGFNPPETSYILIENKKWNELLKTGSKRERGMFILDIIHASTVIFE